jgi:hypothetical protein
MRLYANHCKTFIEDCERNQIAEKLRTSFQLYAKNPSPSEFQSWQNSLRALALIFSRAGLTNQGVMLEFQLPTNSKRIDCLLCGFAKDGTPITSRTQPRLTLELRVRPAKTEPNLPACTTTKRRQTTLLDRVMPQKTKKPVASDAAGFLFPDCVFRSIL